MGRFGTVSFSASSSAALLRAPNAERPPRREIEDEGPLDVEERPVKFRGPEAPLIEPIPMPMGGAPVEEGRASNVPGGIISENVVPCADAETGEGEVKVRGEALVTKVRGERDPYGPGKVVRGEGTGDQAGRGLDPHDMALERGFEAARSWLAPKLPAAGMSGFEESELEVMAAEEEPKSAWRALAGELRPEPPTVRVLVLSSNFMKGKSFVSSTSKSLSMQIAL